MSKTTVLKPNENRQYKVTLLLSRYNDPFSKMIALCSHGKYTHISISLDPEENVFYSFNKKGFIEEHWRGKRSRYLLPDRAYLYFYVDELQFFKMYQEIKRYEERKKDISYSVVGTILCIFHIPATFKKQFFCSQFVAEVLRKSGTVKLKKKSSLYLPMHLLRELKAMKSE